MTQITFPPYGVLPRAYPVGPSAPVDWRGAQSYQSWTEYNLQLIYSVLWPKWNPSSASWEGASAVTMEPMTRADMQILLEYRTDGPNRPFDQRVDSPLRKPGGMIHDQFFKAEDDFKIGESYSEYDAKEVVSPAAVRTMFSSDPTKHSRKLGNTPAYFKHFLQRPRPYQMALLLQASKFNWTLAKTSLTPSIPSGHALQGLVGVACLADQFFTDRIHFDPPHWDALRQLAVDIGDRRVMAGVHYPSDNIASWLLALSLTSHVFDNPKEVGAFMWHAITGRSLVYRRIEKAISSDEAGARDGYGPSWEALHKLDPTCKADAAEDQPTA